jgi:hypothetical protein
MPDATDDFPGQSVPRRKREAIAMLRGLTSATVLTALSTTAAGAASAQPIDLLAPPTVSAPPTNTAPPDTRSVTESSVPAALVPSSEAPVTILAAARRALRAGRIEDAEDALEQGETRLLNGTAAAVQASSPDIDHAVLAIGAARRALAAHAFHGAVRAIDDALAAVTLAARVTTPAAPPAASAQPAPAQPTVTYALLPGHWQLKGAQYVWVPPETVPRPVAYWRFVEGRYVWRGGEWVWVPAHYQ